MDVEELHSVVVGVGSNCGDRIAAMAAAIEWLRGQLTDAVASEVYETAPVGGGTRPYLNAVVRGETALDDATFDRLLKKYEVEHGRDADSRLRGDVPIDIDLVFSCGCLLRPRDFRQQFFKIGYAQIAE